MPAPASALLPLLLLPLLAAAGCGPDRPPGPVTVADSAGVRVVVNRSPAWGEGRGWRVAGAPAAELEVGREGFRPEAVRRLSDGRIVALDGAARRLAVGPPDAAAGEGSRGEAGEGLRGGPSAAESVRVRADTVVEVPRPGDGGVPGPGDGTPEPARLAALLPGDTVAVQEGRTAVLRLFGPGGRRGRLLRLRAPGPGRFAPGIRGAFADGALVATPPFDRMVYPGGRVLRDTLPLLLFGRGGALLDTLGAVASAERYFARVESEAGPIQGRVRRPYAREELVAVGDSVIVTADSHGLTWEARGRGGEARLRASAPFRARPVGAEDIASYREEALRRAPRDYRALRRRLLREVPFPGRKPILRDVLVGPAGHVWAGLARGPWEPATGWRVFAPDGRWLGTVRTPPGLEVQQVGRGFVAGIRRTGTGPPRAVVHRLRRAGG